MSIQGTCGLYIQCLRRTALKSWAFALFQLAKKRKHNSKVRIYRQLFLCECFAYISYWVFVSAPVPALLLLGQSSGESREFKRELMITRCPASPISEWELEIGMLPDPRVAVEFLPGKTNVTVCIIICTSCL